MAETVQEQMEYGSYCKHGTNVGTPGGADLMCHNCEMGYDTWYDDPAWILQVKLIRGSREITPWIDAKDRGGHILGFFRTSQMDGVARTRLMVAGDYLHSQFSDYKDPEGLPIHWEFRTRQVDRGYWG